jgi:hypothetical protein
VLVGLGKYCPVNYQVLDNNGRAAWRVLALPRRMSRTKHLVLRVRRRLRIRTPMFPRRICY